MIRASALAFALTLLGAGSAFADDMKVVISNFTFTPEILTVAPGTTVTWVNEDDIPHNVVATDKGFRSKALDTDQSFSFTFETPGDFAYFCGLHPHMTGKVVVR